jgi:hypothetical protein
MKSAIELINQIRDARLHCHRLRELPATLQTLLDYRRAIRGALESADRDVADSPELRSIEEALAESLASMVDYAGLPLPAGRRGWIGCSRS